MWVPGHEVAISNPGVGFDCAIPEDDEILQRPGSFPESNLTKAALQMGVLRLEGQLCWLLRFF